MIEKTIIENMMAQLPKGHVAFVLVSNPELDRTVSGSNLPESKDQLRLLAAALKEMVEIVVEPPTSRLMH